MLFQDQPAGRAAQLEAAGYALALASDGGTAWEMLVADPGRFHALIVDHQDCGPEGIQLLEQMRAHPVLWGIPVILQTEPAAVSERVRRSATRCLLKPFEPADLLGALAAALQERVCFRSGPVGGYPGSGAGEDCAATFTFKSPHAARELATRLANACPEPQRVVVGLAELLLNAVEHGNLCISYDEKTRLRREECWEEEVAARLADPANADKEVRVEYVRDADRIRVLIRDQGDGFDWRAYLAMDPAEAVGLHGRGIAIARMMSFDSMEYRGKGSEVEVTVDLTPR